MALTSLSEVGVLSPVDFLRTRLVAAQTDGTRQNVSDIQRRAFIVATHRVGLAGDGFGNLVAAASSSIGGYNPGVASPGFGSAFLGKRGLRGGRFMMSDQSERPPHPAVSTTSLQPFSSWTISATPPWAIIRSHSCAIHSKCVTRP